MNYSSIALFPNACQKLDLFLKKNLLLNVYIRYGREVRKIGFNSKNVRYFCTSDGSTQAQKDGITVLPSPQDVTLILRKNEFNKEFVSGPVKSYDSNQLASNDPIEDTRSEALCRMTSGLLLGVFDGHGGPACAQVVSKRLLSYVAAALLPTEQLNNFKVEPSKEALIETYNDRVEIIEELKLQYEKSFRDYLQYLSSSDVGRDVNSSLETAILKFDSDLSKEVLEPFKATGNINPKTLSVALSGAVACVCHIDGPNLHIANVGDCNAVLGTTVNDDNEWVAKKITKEHNTENFDELKRIWKEHPEEERITVIRRDRLLGELAPLRSLGDYRYKWTSATLNEVAVPLVGPKAIPANYHTPPYLTAKPDIYYHRLTSKDKFMIVASDGLWDMMTPVQAVKLVGEHMKGKVFFNPLKLPRKNIQLGDINELLLHRKQSLKSKPKDRNAATHLIRHAIGGTEYGVDHARLAHLLSLSPDVSRMFRDDITVTVIYFDSEYLRQCPA